MDPRDVSLRLNRLERLLAGLPAEATALWDDLRAVKQHLAQRQAALQATEEELARCGQQLGEQQRRCAIAAGQLVAIRRLQSTLERDQMLLALEEVVASLVGCEEMAVFESAGSELQVVHTVGIAPEALETHGLTEAVAQRAAVGEVWIDEKKGAADRTQPRLTACVPLEVDGRRVGTLALFRLLEHKAQLEAPDIELLDLLKVHVGVALVATRAGQAA